MKSMKWVVQAPVAFVQAQLHRPVSELGRMGRTLRYMWDLGHFTARQLSGDRAGMMASALTYHTLFSLLPTLVLMLVVQRIFVSPQEMDTLRESTVSWVLSWLDEEPGTGGGLLEVFEPSESSLATLGEEPMFPAEVELPLWDEQQMLAEDPEAARAREFRQARKGLAQGIEQAIDQLQRIDFGSIGIVGVLVFIYGATRLLTSIETSFNHIYRASTARAWYLRLPLYYTTITLGPLVLAAGQYVRRQVIELIQSGEFTAFLAGPLVVITPLLTTWMVLMLMYLLLPNTRVQIRAAVIGSLVAAVGVAMVFELFGVYVRNAGSASLYGALAILPLFLLWLWLLWMAILFGLELAYTLQVLPDFRREAGRSRGAEQAVLSPEGLVLLMAEAARCFQRGQVAGVRDLSRVTGWPEAVVERWADRLVVAGYWHRVGGHPQEARPTEAAWTPARPMEQVTINDLYDLAGDWALESGSTQATVAGDLRTRLRDERRAAFAQRTLAELLETGRV